MALDHPFSPELDRAAAGSCINDGNLGGRNSIAVSLTTTASSALSLSPGVYLVFLDGLDPLKSVVIKTGNSSVVAQKPTPGTDRDSAVFPGNSVERLRVLPGNQYVSALLTQGSGTLYLVPLVKL